MSVIASGIRVPFLDLGPSHRVVKDDILADVGDLIDSNRFINGPQVADFEASWADYCGTRRCVGVASGLGAGTAGRAAAFSVYPGKNLGAMGDAGARVTDDEELAARIVALREHGQRAKYRHDFEGYTARLDTMQAIVLQHKLRHLDDW